MHRLRLSKFAPMGILLLSDLGRGVAALGIRGDRQPQVQKAFAEVQAMIVRFLTDRAGFTGWARERLPPAAYTMNIYPRNDSGQAK